MKKQIIIVICLLLSITACSAEKIVAKEPAVTTERLTSIDSNTVDELVTYATNLVEATLTSVEDFDGHTYVYQFKVTKDYTKNTSEEIHVYHEFDRRYVLGHSYYLILDGVDNALYPHTIYTMVASDLVLDAEETQALNNYGDIQMDQVAGILSRAMQEDSVGTGLGELPQVSFVEEISEVSSAADVVARLRVSQEDKANPYTSNYQVEVLEILKGPDGSVPAYLSLPPDLDAEKEYYVFLAEDPEIKGEYYVFSQVFPVLEVSAASTEALSIK